jgi:hypothetical protein
MFGLYDPDNSPSTSHLSFIFRIICNPNIAEIFLILNLVILPAQLFAREYPVEFLNLRGCMLVLRACLVLEALGLAHFGWYLFYLTKHGRLSDRYHTSSTRSDDDEDDDGGGDGGDGDSDDDEDMISL